MYDSLTVIPISTMKEMSKRVKSFTDLEIEKEGRKSHNETKKEVY